jgi:hypothetical protein
MRLNEPDEQSKHDISVLQNWASESHAFHTGTGEAVRNTGDALNAEYYVSKIPINTRENLNAAQH